MALLAAALLPACGGGGENGDRYVSIQQFESGGAGFFISGIGASMRIVSNGVGNNDDIVYPGISEGNLPLPDQMMNANENLGDLGWIQPPGWEESDKIADESKVLSGELIISGVRVAYIDAMIYQMEAGNNRAYLRVQYEGGVNNSLFTQYLARFFGYVSTSDISSGTGNTGANVWVDTENTTRVVLPSAQGTSLEVWFDFRTGLAVVQLTAAKQITIHHVLTDTDENGVTVGSLNTGANCPFYRTSR